MFEEKLLNDLKQLQINTSKPIAEYVNTYIVNYNGLLGVAVETNCNVDINESFNNVSLIKAEIRRDEANRKVILLYVSENHIDNFFIKLCCAFLEDSEMVSTKPVEWYNGWKNMLGNKKTEKMIYDVISELKVLCYLLEQKDEPNLDSADKATFDISSKSGFYEVKASTIKTKEVITIHNQFQLDTKSLDRPLYIAYCKAEKNDSGDSINSLYRKIKQAGYDISQIDSYLSSLGYYNGSLDRDVKYLIHEMRFYEVNNDFPRINDKSFKNDKFPPNVIKIEYTVSLDGLNYNKII